MKSKVSNYLLVTAVALLCAVAGTLYGQARQMPAKQGVQTLTTLRGKKIIVRAEGQVFAANAPDGEYKLTNRGAIRVRGGKVVWDAFGAVQRLKAAKWRGGYADPVG